MLVVCSLLSVSSIPYIDVPLMVIHSPSERHSCNLQFLMIINKGAIKHSVTGFYVNIIHLGK